MANRPNSGRAASFLRFRIKLLQRGAVRACPPLRHVAAHTSHCGPDHIADVGHWHLHAASNSPPFAHKGVVAHAAGNSASAYVASSSEPASLVPALMRP